MLKSITGEAWQRSELEIKEKENVVPKKPNEKIKVSKPKKSKPKTLTIKPRDNQGDHRRKWCPIPYCKHHGGKGLVNRKVHFKYHAAEFNHNSQHLPKIKKGLEEDEAEKFPCVGCKTLKGYSNSQDLCLICAPAEENICAIKYNTNKQLVESWIAELEELNRKHLVLLKGYPQPTAQSFFLALDYCHQAEINAKTVKEIWMLKIQLAELKAVWVLDVRGGRKNGRTWIEKVTKRCNLVLAGRIDEVWQEACEIEMKR